MAIRGASITRLHATGIALLVISVSTLAIAEEPQRWSRQISNTNFLNDWVPVQPNQPNQPNQHIQHNQQHNQQQQQPHQQPHQQLQQQPQQQQQQHHIGNHHVAQPLQAQPLQQAQSVQTAQQVRAPTGRVLNFGPPYQQPQSLHQQQQHQPPFGATIFHNNVQPAPAGVSFAHEQFPHRLMFHHQQPSFLQQSPQGQPPFLLNGVLPQMLVHQQPPPQLLQHAQPPQPNQNYQFQHFGGGVNQVQQLPQIQQLPQPLSTHASFLGDVSSQQKPHVEPLVQHHPSADIGIDRPVKSKSSTKNNNNNNNNKDQDEVQLLYVPLDTLYQQQRDKIQNTKYSVLPHGPVNPLQINNLYAGPTALPLSSPSSPKPTRTPRPSSPSPSPTPYEGVHRYSTPSSQETSSRLKPHQPPLAMFMLNEGKQRGSVSDVLSTLANANSIDVLDSASRRSPKVFVGPSGLNAPNGYTKFELPYLSNIEQTRLERQIDKLPFFVAPLSYRAPKGFAKIPLPAPHVGSVVVNSINDDNGGKAPQVNYQPTKAYYSDVQNEYPTTPSENVQYITIPSPSPLPNSQVRSTTAGYTPGRFNFGFSFGPDDFTTTPRPNAYFASSTPAYVTQDAEPVRTKSPSTRHPQRNSRPSAAASTGSLPLLHSTREEATEAPPTDSSFSPQQNSEIYSYKPFPPAQTSNNDFFNGNKNTPSFAFSQFPANGTSITTQVFGSVSDNEFQSPSFGSFINHYGPSTPIAHDFFNQPATTTHAPAPVKYTFPSLFDETVTVTTTPKPTRASTTRARLPSAPTVVPLGNEYSTPSEIITKPKNYYKAQDVYKSRVPASPSPPPQVYETDAYDTLGYNIGSSTPSFLQDTVLYNRDRNTPTTEGYFQTNPPTTPRSTFTYYTASSIDDEDSPVVNHKFVDSVTRHKENSTPNSRIKANDYSNSYTGTNEPQKYKTTYDDYYNPVQQQTDDYTATTPSYYEPTRNDYRGDKVTEDFTSPKYQLPSELPPISPNLPGLVNSLMDKHKNSSPTTTTTAVPATTRRGPTRGRRPQVQRTTTPASATDDEGNYVEITTRRNPPRSRRPVPTYSSSNRTTTSRTPVTRNSQRVRYNPSTEERQRYRTRTRTNSEGASKTRTKEEENIDYQRDVLKQNYPVINREDRTTTTTTERLAEFNDPGVIYHTSERVVDLPSSADITANNLQDQFATLQDTMQIPQQYQGLTKEIDVHEIGNYPPVFFSRDTPIAQEQQRIPPAPTQVLIENTERTVVITPTTPPPVAETTVSEIVEVPRTRRPSFIRRPHTSSSTTVTTTPASPVTVTQEYEVTKTKEKYQPRPKLRYDSNSSQARPKTRTRTRRPTTEAPTTLSNNDEESSSETKPFRKVNRYNKDLYKDHSQNKRPLKESSAVRATVSPPQEQKKTYLQRQSSRFALDTEESQWSSKLGQNSFRPVSLDEEQKSADNRPEPEIVTAGYGDSQSQETYSFTVAAKNVFGGGINEASTLKVGLPEATSTSSTESSIADLIKAAISDFSNDIPSNPENDDDDSEEELVTTTQKLDTTSATSRSDVFEKKNRRRGVWKRVRVRPIDGFETAESQNIGKQIYNTILSDGAKETFDKGATKTYQSYDLSKDNGDVVDESSEEATVVPSPGDIDLGTGKPEDILVNGTFRDSTTTEKVGEYASTQEPDVVTTVVQGRDDNEHDDDDDNVDEEDDDDKATVTTTQADYKIKESTPSTTTSVPAAVVASSVDTERAPATDANDATEVDQSKYTTDASDDETSKSEEQTSDSVAIDEQTNPQANVYMDEVRQKLSSLFSFPDEPAPTKDLVINKTFKRSRGPSYATIERKNAVAANALTTDVADKDEIKPSSMRLRPVSIEKTILHPIAEKKDEPPAVTESSFHRDLMDSVIFATSTSTEVTHETEICYRGRCVKSVRKP